ncbi:hypothetical protein NC652_030354 [Populus alba x Populus x berolinensis]|nr:hypothetical protein NC652_030354 [Populus alba x Populus x berolinensis]
MPRDVCDSIFGPWIKTRKTDTRIPDPYANRNCNPAEIPEGYERNGCLMSMQLIHGVPWIRRSLYLRYTVEWVDWDCDIIPVKIFIFDVTDTGKRLNVSDGLSPENGCQVEYDVELAAAPLQFLMDVLMSKGQADHAGRTFICTSEPIYGEGKDAGDEADESIRIAALAIVALGLAVVAVGLRYRLRKGREEGYQPIMARAVISVIP